MVHPFFLKVRETREIFCMQFRERFKVFFLEDEEGYNNVSTWLDEVASFFPSEGFQIPAESLLIAQSYFTEFGVDRNENLSVFHFWALLIAIDQNLQNHGFTRDDNIFAFMVTQKFNDVQVVIIGNDPHESELSSGFAFHNSKCDSTRNLIGSVQYEMNLISVGENESPLQLDDGFYTDAKDNCDLSGWISQNVLLINIILTYSRNYPFVTEAWKNITGFFIKRLNDSRNSAVFMLLGMDVSIHDKNGTEPLINCETHLKLELYHPGNYWQQIKNLSWESKLPFINTNLYLHQRDKANYMVDWMSINSVLTEKENRMIELRKLFDDIIVEETSGTWRSLSIVNEDGVRQMRKNSP
ncbi:Uracil-DNA glycosylase [Orchesella cincta]|uniref:Uracil-DNA glycosylase n=1 Tax=Orchesella cincta TaxID=48709 RepID=A0A1D2MYS6_ORCCI|nr:Uracil-DNA glycosylase [Orchesella cincta]